MDIKKNVEIKADFTMEDVTDLIRQHVESQGYELVKVVFKDKELVHHVSHQESLMGYSSRSHRVFDGAEVFLKEKADKNSPT